MAEQQIRFDDGAAAAAFTFNHFEPASPLRQLRMLYLGALQSAGVDDLWHVAPNRGELGHRPGVGGVLIRGRPEVGHELVGDAPVEKRACPA